MGLDEFVGSHDVEIAEQRIDTNELKILEKQIRSFLLGLYANMLTTEETVRKEKDLQTVFGPELKRYLLDYGYINYGEVSFYGMSKGDPLSSSLIIQTKYFNKNHPATCGKFVIEDRGGSYALVAPDDEVFIYEITQDESKEPVDTGMKLTAYMMNRLSSAHGERLYKEGEIETYEQAWETFERDLNNHNLPDFGQPSVKEVMAKKKEKMSLYSKKELRNHIHLPSMKMLTERCVEMLNANNSIPAETDIWVDKCVAYYFPHGAIRNDSRMITKTGDASTYYLDPKKVLYPLYKYRGYTWYTWKEIYSFIIY